MAAATMHVELASAYAIHSASVIRYLAGITRDPSAAEDLAQEAFVRLMGEVDAGRPPTNVGSWLFRVASNLAASRGRHLAVVARHAEALAQRGGNSSAEDEALERERATSVGRALSRLGRPDREVILMAASGIDGQGMATLLGKSPEATRTMLCRARARLRRELIADGFER